MTKEMSELKWNRNVSKLKEPCYNDKFSSERVNQVQIVTCEVFTQ